VTSPYGGRWILVGPDPASRNQIAVAGQGLKRFYCPRCKLPHRRAAGVRLNIFNPATVDGPIPRTGCATDRSTAPPACPRWCRLSSVRVSRCGCRTHGESCVKLAPNSQARNTIAYRLAGGLRAISRVHVAHGEGVDSVIQKDSILARFHSRVGRKDKIL